MKLTDAPELNLSQAVLALMNTASGSIEEISRETLVAIAMFIQNQGEHSNCGGLNSIVAFGAAASKEYKELFDFRAEMNERYAIRAADPNRYMKGIYWDIAIRNLSGEITEEEMYRLNDERIEKEKLSHIEKENV